MNKEELIEQFKSYVSTYDMTDYAILMKYYHSIRVMELSSMIAENLNLNKSDIKLASIIGLLHDYARFPQWKKYKTFSDITSIDHANYAIDILFPNEIQKYHKKEEEYPIIMDAIKYHNKLSLPNKLTNKTFCNIVRDADKLDILYLFGINKDLFEEDNKNISRDVEDIYYSKQPISYTIIKNKSDRILLNLALIYDLNFDYSYKYIKENNLINKIFEKIYNKEKYKKYFDFINKYIDERID